MDIKFQDGIKIINNKKRTKYWKKYYKEHKFEVRDKVKKWQEKQKYKKFLLNAVDKYGDLIYKVVKYQIEIYDKLSKKGK